MSFTIVDSRPATEFVLDGNNFTYGSVMAALPYRRHADLVP